MLTVIVLALLGHLLVNTDFTQIIESIRQVDISLLLLLVGLQVLTQILLVFQWCKLADLMQLPSAFTTMALIHAQGTIMDAVTPGAKVGGEVARMLLLNERLGYTTHQSTALIAIQKLISVGALVAINLASVLLFANNNPFLSASGTRIGLMALMVSLLAFFLLLLFQTDWLATTWARGKSQAKWFLAMRDWLVDFAGYTQAVRGQRKYLFYHFLLAVFIWAFFPAKLVLLVRPFGITRSYLALVATTLAAYLVAMIPIFPGGLGSFEVTMSSMLIALGLANEQALTVSLSFRFVTFWLVVIVCLGIVAWDSFRQRSQPHASGSGDRK